MPRPQLLKIRLIYAVEGSQVPLELDVDPCRTTSLFFDEQAAVEILGAFYEGKGKTITRDQAIARFGTRAEAWFPKGKDELPLNKKFLKLAWGMESKRPRRSKAQGDPRADADSLPMLLMKGPDCMPSGQP
ncbi:MAG: hypothetical protein IPP58_08835 [Holophagaceae bacterium]|uniref:Uncharacterized protein n=1 Tax=Candidatus Geothrix skivensis TaxID=2954439 RepID=A0A9D7XLG6_9BACT|nr:hypothetical protein [Candidatus Geothrix skivensis]